MVLESAAVRWVRAAAVTICPVILIDPELGGRVRSDVLKHEWAHWWQQFVFGVVGVAVGVSFWFVASWPPQPGTAVVMALGLIEGWVAGQLLWRWLYLVGLPFGLPIGWNPWRHRWETAAFLEEGRLPAEIRRWLRKPPYYLWWH